MNVNIEPSWKEHLSAEFEKPYFVRLTDSVRQEYHATTCYPPGHLIFNAFNLCPFDKVKVVIIGQDPYHEPQQAMGLSFSVPEGVMVPPSLVNIFKEIEQDLGTPVPHSGDLTRWARSAPTSPTATADWAGTRSPTLSSASSTPTASTSSICSGAVMPGGRNTSSTRIATSSWSRCTPHRSLPTAAAGSATISSRAVTNTLKLTERSP